MNQFDSIEEPLRGGIPYYYKNQADWKKSSFQGPKRAIRLCILCNLNSLIYIFSYFIAGCILFIFVQLLGIVLPGLLIGVPLYLK